MIYARLNEFAMIEPLMNDGWSFFEARAIAEYLDELFGGINSENYEFRVADIRNEWVAYDLDDLRKQFNCAEECTTLEEAAQALIDEGKHTVLIPHSINKEDITTIVVSND